MVGTLPLFLLLNVQPYKNYQDLDDILSEFSYASDFELVGPELEVSNSWMTPGALWGLVDHIKSRSAHLDSRLRDEQEYTIVSVLRRVFQLGLIAEQDGTTHIPAVLRCKYR